MFMFNSNLVTVIVGAPPTPPATTGALFVYAQKNRNAWLLMEDTAGHANAIDVVIRIWGLLEGKDSTEDATWWIIDEFTVATDGPVGQFLSYPLSFSKIYVQEVAGGTTNIKCKLVSDDKIGGA